ncbi:MAG: SDR family oxidoreductase, partial [Acidobacteriota bacterium]
QHLRSREEGLPTHILHLWSATAEAPSYDAAQRAGLLSLLFLEQALLQTSGGSEGPAIRIGVVTAGAHEVVEGDRVIPARATVLGASKVIHQESRQLTCASIDVALPAPGSPGEERLIGQLLAEMEVPEAELEPAVAYRGRQRWVRTFGPVRVPEVSERGGASRLRPDGAYLITDGAHAVGVALARALAGGGAKVAVVLPADAATEEPWGERGIVVLRADLTDPESLAGALTKARNRFGGLDGVLHTAAPFTGGLIQLKTPEALDASLRPVARGAEAL